MRPKKIRIEKVLKESFWYKDEVGKTFFVVDEDHLDYRVVNNHKLTNKLIRKEDCVNSFIIMMEKAIDKSKHNKKFLRKTI